MRRRALSTFGGAERGKQLGSNLFAEFSELANRYNAVNLGQGFPSFGTPDFVKEAAADAVLADQNQYSRPGGHPELIQTLESLYSSLYNRQIDGMSEIVTFNGAQEGIFSIFAALLNEGDQVIIVEPYFDAYIKAASILGIETVGIPLEFSPERQKEYNDRDSTGRSFAAGDLQLDLNRLEAMITPKTRMVVLNTPHNPTGKVFSKRELEQICSLMKRHPNVLILSDEVYEFMCFDNLKHERIASFPDMYDQVISLFSAGKTFSCTGWRVGYSICSPDLAKLILKMHNAIPFCVATPLEIAVAKSFQQAQVNGYFKTLPKMLQKRRDQMIAVLAQANLNPIVPQGGYFTCCDSSRLSMFNEIESSSEKSARDLPDFQMALKLCKEYGLATIPTSPFYSQPNKHLAGAMIRLAYCKDQESLATAHQRFSTASQVIIRQKYQ